ncbi:MAG: hypothetical protein EA001_07235 [Oscillatoriales cyanobacterium]|nr:MAG: hypothetical protein EA001_07235 [Oscillatoriales cyanobacterium]
MRLSEITTILVAFHQQGDRNFKTCYHNHVAVYWRAEFPTLVSYSRLSEYLPLVLLLLCAYLRHCFGSCRGISRLAHPIADAMKLLVGRHCPPYWYY